MSWHRAKPEQPIVILVQHYMVRPWMRFVLVKSQDVQGAANAVRLIAIVEDSERGLPTARRIRCAQAEDGSGHRPIDRHDSMRRG
jgi:hypothetical protein